jgi:adenosylmethionine-8-amino-7-oxononanoate aminotransferase
VLFTENNQIQDDLAVNWHPFMQMKDFEKYPPKRIIRAKGLKLFSEDSWYYDTISSWWCNILGHCHPKIIKALQSQIQTLDHIMFGNFTHDPAIELSKKLVAITPKGLDRVYYSDNGSTAFEVALKMSLHYWVNMGQKNKTKIIFFKGSYHGDTIGAMSVSGVSQYNQMFRPLMFESIQIHDPSNNESQALEHLDSALHQKSQDVAAVVLEPLLMGAGGMKITSPDFLKNVRRLTKKHHVHLISDEVATGFGRTGHLFASNAANVTPDFMCLSKALTNGQLPLAVTMLTDEIYRAFYADFQDGKTFYHGHTFTANTFGCVVANATLTALDEWDWKRNVDAIHQRLGVQLNQLNDQFYCLSNPRAIGTVGAIDIDLPGDRAMFELTQIGFEHHLTIRPLGNTLYLYLPLVTTQDELNDIFNQLSTVITKAING